LHSVAPRRYALFWFLFGVVLVVLAVPTVLQIFGTVFGQPLLPEPTRGLLYASMRSGSDDALPSRHPLAHSRKVRNISRSASGRDRRRPDLLAFFFVPMRVMLPADAMTRDVSISDAQSLLLLIAAFIRLQFVRAGRTAAC